MANQVTESASIWATYGGDNFDYRHTLAHLESSGLKRISVAASTSKTVDFDNIATATGIFVTADQAFTVTVNGADTAQTYAANGKHEQFDTSVTSLAVANSSATTAANFQILIVGA